MLLCAAELDTAVATDVVRIGLRVLEISGSAGALRLSVH